MNKVNRAALTALLETEDNVTLSLYLPTHRLPSSEHIGEDKIRLKNLVRAGKEALQKQGVDEGIIAQLITQIEDEIYDNESFWQQTTEGLALFCSPAGIRYFHLPLECDEYVSAGDRYDITMLLALISCDQPYYLLALAVHNPVLYRGDMYGVERVAVDLPESVEKALGIDEMYSNSQTARAGGYGAGNPGTKSHGQGDSRHAGQEERLKYFRIIDDIIQSASDVDTEIPFLLAGTDDEVSGYRESSKLRNVLQASLGGSSTEVSLQDIHLRAWPLVREELCENGRGETIEKLQSLLGTGKASAGADDIVAAAVEGKVDTLLIGMITTTRDTVNDSDDAEMKLVISEDYDYNQVAVGSRATFDQGGEVVAVQRNALPEDAYLAAVYRY